MPAEKKYYSHQVFVNVVAYLGIGEVFNPWHERAWIYSEYIVLISTRRDNKDKSVMVHLNIRSKQNKFS